VEFLAGACGAVMSSHHNVFSRSGWSAVRKASSSGMTGSGRGSADQCGDDVVTALLPVRSVSRLTDTDLTDHYGHAE
jgi:hypothetical protein